MNYQDAVNALKKDPSRENLDKQARSLVAEMTLKEKVKMTYGINMVSFGARMIWGVVRGSFLRYPFLGGGCKRLGIPKIVFTDGPRGIVTGRSTCFPVASMRAASFDDDLEWRVSKAMADEAIAGGCNYFAGICLNVVRNPMWGRAAESYGEDPFVLGRKGEILVKAMQEEGIIACPKHFALNSIENLRFNVNVSINERALREVYLPHFQKCIDAGTHSIMSAYNKVRGEYCGENKALLTDILRDEMGFDGFVMSDFMMGVHACKESYEAGLDIEMPSGTHHAKAVKMVENGEMDESLVDRAAYRIVRAQLAMTPNIKPRDKSVVKSAKHRALAKEAALKGSVLLKNNGVLPVPTTEKIAVVGPFANEVNTGDNGSSSIWCKDGVTPYEGLKRIYQDVAVYNGLVSAEAVKAAQNASTVIVVAGSDRFHEGEMLANNLEDLEKSMDNRVGGVGGDRATLHLRKEEIEMIKALKQTGKKVIVSLLSGSVFITKDFEDYTDGIFMSFYGGVEAGNALAELVSGKANPCGKMPFTIANAEEEYPPFLVVGQKPYEIEYGYYHGYTLFDKLGKEPAYPFGFGLSYTTFDVQPCGLTQTTEGVTVAYKIKNTGKVTGAEVVQIYVGSAGAEDDRPVKLLRGYDRVELQPGDEKEGSIFVDAKDLRFYHPETKSWELDKAYHVYVGTSSRNATKLEQAVEF